MVRQTKFSRYHCNAIIKACKRPLKANLIDKLNKDEIFCATRGTNLLAHKRRFSARQPLDYAVKPSRESCL